MFVFSNMHPAEGDPAVMQVLVFSDHHMKQHFEETMAARILIECQVLQERSPELNVFQLALKKVNINDAGVAYKLRAVRTAEGQFLAVIRNGVDNGWQLWSSEEFVQPGLRSFDTPKEAINYAASVLLSQITIAVNYTIFAREKQNAG